MTKETVRRWWEKSEHEYTNLDWYELRDDVLNYLAEKRRDAKRRI